MGYWYTVEWESYASSRVSYGSNPATYACSKLPYPRNMLHTRSLAFSFKSCYNYRTADDGTGGLNNEKTQSADHVISFAADLFYRSLVQ